MSAGFAAALLDPALPVPSGITDPTGRSAFRRFAVHRNTVVSGLVDAVATGFPALHRHLGEALFHATAGTFVRAYPPVSPLLMLYGGALPGFLAGFAPLSGRPWLSDLARLELALRESYHAADAPGLDAANIAALPPDRLLSLRLRLAPSLRLLRSDWPVLDLWQTDSPPAPAARPQDVLVLRPGFDPTPHLLPPGGANFVAALLSGQSVGAAMDAGGSDHPLAETWTLLLANGALTGIEETNP